VKAFNTFAAVTLLLNAPAQAVADFEAGTAHPDGIVAIAVVVESAPTATPIVPPPGALVQVGSGFPDDQGFVSIDVTLDSYGATVGGVQNDLIFDNTIVELVGGKCEINPTIGPFPLGPPPAITCLDDPTIGPCKNLSNHLQQCSGPARGDGCPTPAGPETSVLRAIIAATAAPNNNPLPDAVVLYSCRFRVIAPSRLPTALHLSNVVVSNPTGTRVDSSIDDGFGEIHPPSTPVPTLTSVATLVPPTNTPTSSATAPAGGGSAGEGCQVSVRPTIRGGFWTLVFLVQLLWVRRTFVRSPARRPSPGIGNG
jgi:hypothetical protein